VALNAGFMFESLKPTNVERREGESEKEIV